MSVPGLLTLTAAGETLTYNGASYVNTSALATVNIGQTIPHQVIILRGYTVVCNGWTPPTATPVIYVDLPFLGGASVKDELSYMNRLPLLISAGANVSGSTGDFDAGVYTGVTQYTEMTVPLQLFQDIQPQFVMGVYTRDGKPINTSDITSVSLQFSYGFNNLQ